MPINFELSKRRSPELRSHDADNVLVLLGRHVQKQ